MRLLQGLIVPEKGSVQVERPVGLVFQNPDHQILFPTVLEELTFGLTERGVYSPEVEDRAQDLARRYGASELLKLATHELSAGQKTLICILAILIDQPKTLLLDESFSHLDSLSSRRMTRMVRESPARTLLSTHQTHLLKDFDEIIWLNRGKVQMQGRPGDVLKAYQDWSEGAC